MNATMEPVTEPTQQAQPQPQQAPVQQQSPISYARPGAAGKRPLSERVNVRMLVFAGVILFLLGWPVYTFLSETLTHGIHNRGSYLDVDLKAMGQFDFDRDGGTLKDVPPQYQALDGKRVVLEGEIYDPTEAGAITSWQLVYSIQKCCFGGPPLVQERVFLQAPSDKRMARYDLSTLVNVTGTLHVKLDRDSTGTVTSVYTMVPDSVTPVS